MRALKNNYITDETGKRKSIVLPLKKYERLLEDLHDLAVVAERREEIPISLKELKRRFSKNASL